jgi:HAD superfamily hydrolase (TIGR01509 family)
MLKGVIFDMDGVLVNSEPTNQEACRLLLEEYNKELSDELYKTFIGSTEKNLIKTLLKEYMIPLTEEEFLVEMRRRRRLLFERDGYEGIEGTPELLKNLKAGGMLLAIASSSSMEVIEEVTESLGIGEYFDLLVTGESVEHPKPAPDVFLKAAHQLGLEPSECIVIEDSNNGVRAAVAAGMACIGFENPDSGEQDLSKADIIVLGFEEVDLEFVLEIYKRSVGEPLIIGETEHLLIREMKIEDLPVIRKFYEEENTGGYMEPLSVNEEFEIDRLKKYIKFAYGFCGYGLWAVFLKETGEFVGQIGFTNAVIEGENELQLGYIIGMPHRRKGYAFEAAKCVLNYGRKKLGLDKFHMLVDSMNQPSRLLAVKLGFRKVGTLEEDGKKLEHYILRS